MDIEKVKREFLQLDEQNFNFEAEVVKLGGSLTDIVKSANKTKLGVIS